MLMRAVWSVVLIGLFGLTFQDARAQADEKKFEVGGQFSLLRLDAPTATVRPLPCAGPLPPCPFSVSFTSGRDSEPGFGGRFGYNFSKYFALEAEGNFFPRDRNFNQGRKVQGLFGVKAGRRFEKVGVFAKARPGFIRFEKGDYRLGPAIGICQALFPPLLLSCVVPVARTHFNVDLGGVVELYPSKRTIIRFDAGDTIVRIGAHNMVAQFPPVPPSLAPTLLVVVPVAARTTHNFQGSVGFGFRF